MRIKISLAQDERDRMFFDGVEKMSLVNVIKAALVLASLGIHTVSHSQQTIFVGKNDWLFGSYTIAHENRDSEVLASVDLIRRTNLILKKANINLVVITVPFKMELYQDNLPNGMTLSAYMKGFNGTILSRLSQSNVPVIDLLKPMQQAIQNDPQTQLFYKLDSHWTHSGTLVAAKAIQQGLVANVDLKNIYDSIPAAPYTINWDKAVFVQSKIRDLAISLPPGGSVLPPERTKSFTVVKGGETAAGTVATNTEISDVVLAGSSASGDWLHFPDALRYSLQRNVYNFSINAEAGPWGVLRGYLQSDNFQAKKASLLIWEIPGQVFQIGPNYQARLDRYRTDPQLWILQIAALSEPSCNPYAVSVSTKTKAAPASDDKGIDTKQGSFELSFDKSLDSSMYLSANVAPSSNRQMMIESWGKNKVMARANMDVGGNSQQQNVKIPIGVGLKDINQIKLTGISSIKDIQICRYSENWLLR